MKILLSWSSGKDSAWMLHVLNQQAPGSVAALLTTVNEAYDRVAMHGVRGSVLRAQADAAGLPLITASDTVALFERSLRRADARGGRRRPWPTVSRTSRSATSFSRTSGRYREDRLAGTGLHRSFLSGGDRLPRWRAR